ncbi:MAG: ATP-binding cassette domain-containing protein [Actinomycetota bacterium]|nr:ATP-binding cassette domain-containing protein [Actinomycetota bacterium]
MAAVVELVEANVRFGGTVALDHLSLRVEHGEALGIVGPNGAGKTTLCDVLSGDLRPTSGRVFLHGENVTDLGPAPRARRGLARTTRPPAPFAGLTAFENCLVGATFATPLGRRARRRACLDVLERTGLVPVADVAAAALAPFEQRRLELARALVTGPSVLVLDELAGGLAAAEVDELVAIVSEVHRSGVAIVWVEHVVVALAEIADRLMAIDFGRKFADGEPGQVMSSADVQRVHLGSDP